MQRYVQRRRFLLVRHRRLDRLDAARDGHAVALREQLVEGGVLEVATRQTRHERFAHVQRLDRHRRAVRQAQPRDDEDLLGRRDVQASSEVRARERLLERERLRTRFHPAAAHVLAEGRHRQLLRDLGLADEGAASASPHEEALADEVVEGGAHGQARHPEVGRQLALGGDRTPGAEALDQVDDLIAGLALLRDPLRGGHAEPS